ncbi:hypothetical protein GCM10012275_60650 [Longimycelium tulufanense]|uniref:Uncharacterized protein n=1 Tax=Longimycelium tulufanense TaxID=907463 RepID=A0A8J3CEC3_9PSEU|nr:hypothetical protein [Longimycelium tulufanense]GGM81939.1 hypothetical protein GCM10012275_60650 [Longimycelium tulufanense]
MATNPRKTTARYRDRAALLLDQRLKLIDHLAAVMEAEEPALSAVQAAKRAAGVMPDSARNKAEAMVAAANAALKAVREEIRHARQRALDGGWTLTELDRIGLGRKRRTTRTKTGQEPTAPSDDSAPAGRDQTAQSGPAVAEPAAS